jgi:hypothetical protein
MAIPNCNLQKVAFCLTFSLKIAEKLTRLIVKYFTMNKTEYVAKALEKTKALAALAVDVALL